MALTLKINKNDLQLRKQLQDFSERNIKLRLNINNIETHN